MTEENENPNDKPNDKTPVETPAKPANTSPLLEATRAENDRTERLLKENKALQERREASISEQMLSGHTIAGQPNLTPDQEFEAKAKKMSDEIVGAFYG